MPYIHFCIQNMYLSSRTYLLHYSSINTVPGSLFHSFIVQNSYFILVYSVLTQRPTTTISCCVVCLVLQKNIPLSKHSIPCSIIQTHNTLFGHSGLLLSDFSPKLSIYTVNVNIHMVGCFSDLVSAKPSPRT